MTEHNPVKRFQFGNLAAVTSAALCAAIIAGDGLRSPKTNHLWDFNIFIVLHAIQLLAGLISFLSCFAIPRRPSLALDNYAVDGQYTVSALGRYTFAWAGKTLRLARAKNKMSLEAIPKLHLRIRSAFLERHVSGLRKDKDHLLKTLLLAHGSALFFQTCFAVASSIVQFAPQAVMFALLKLLEQKADVSEFTRAAWPLVFALGLAILVSAWGEAWTHWMFITRLGLPLRTELAAMVFSKATRRIDVKGVQTQNEQIPEGTPLIPADAVQASSQNAGEASDAMEEGVQKSRQGTINLVVG